MNISNATSPEKRYFVILDPNGNVIVGDLAQVPESQRLIASDSAAYRVDIGDWRDTYVRSARLADGSRFIVIQPGLAVHDVTDLVPDVTRRRDNLGGRLGIIFDP